MAVFEYHGRDATGKRMSGKLAAASAEAVAEQLLKYSITPTSIVRISKEKSSLFQSLNINFFRPKVKNEELIIFCRQMYILTKAGVSLINTLERLKETMHGTALADVLQGLVDTISSGQSFTSALQKYPNVFKPIFIGAVDAGENSGQLEQSFSQLADYLELEAITFRQLKAATRYPMIVLTILAIAFSIINFFVVPAFAQLFKQFKAELPLPTRLLIGVSNFFIAHWLFLLVTVLLIIFGVRYFLKTERGPYVWDRLQLKIPIIGSLLKRIILSRFARSFAMVMQTGVPLIKGVELVANAIGNRYIQERILTMCDAIKRGESLTKTAINTKLFSPLVIQMLSIGEETGEMEKLLLQVAEFYEREVEYDIKRLNDLLQPIMLIIMAVFVLIFALGVFLPMWNMIGFAKR